MTDDIVKRIEREVQFWRSHEEDTHLMKEAAETVTRLRADLADMRREADMMHSEYKTARAEVEKLRAALMPFADFEKCVKGSIHFGAMYDSHIVMTTGDGSIEKWIYRKHFRAAAAAIREGEWK